MMKTAGLAARLGWRMLPACSLSTTRRSWPSAKLSRNRASLPRSRNCGGAMPGSVISPRRAGWCASSSTGSRSRIPSPPIGLDDSIAGRDRFPWWWQPCARPRPDTRQSGPRHPAASPHPPHRACRSVTRRSSACRVALPRQQSMSRKMEHEPGDPAPVGGIYRLLNVFGTPIAYLICVIQGEPLPPAPIGCRWRLEQIGGSVDDAIAM